MSNIKKEGFVKNFVLKYNAILMLIVLVIASTILSDVFLTWGNVTNLLRQQTPLMLISIGMLLVILTGGIDLSVGSIAAVGGMVCAVTLNAFDSFNLVIALILSLLVGAILGGIIGYFIAFTRMAPFVATLAMMTIARGIAYMISNGEPIRYDMSKVGQKLLSDFGGDKIPGIELPWPVLLSIVAVIIAYLVVKYTSFGRMVIATGSNENAVRLAGITVQKYKFSVYAISGMLSALGGLIISSRASIGTPVAGLNLELDAIAACVIGGASLNGGKGTVMNTVIGVLVLGLIGNIMNLLSVPAYPQQITKGVIIIIAVLLQSITNKER